MGKISNKINNIIFSVCLLCLAGLAVVSVAAFKNDDLFENSMRGAKRMAETAYGYYRKHGTEQLVKAINKDSLFKNRHLFAFVVRDDGIILAHSYDKDFIGMDVAQIVDVAGTKTGDEILDVRDKKWIEFYWINDLTNKVQKKKAYIIYEDNIYICVSVYVVE